MKILTIVALCTVGFGISAAEIAGSNLVVKPVKKHSMLQERSADGKISYLGLILPGHDVSLKDVDIKIDKAGMSIDTRKAFADGKTHEIRIILHTLKNYLAEYPGKECKLIFDVSGQGENLRFAIAYFSKGKKDSSNKSSGVVGKNPAEIVLPNVSDMNRIESSFTIRNAGIYIIKDIKIIPVEKK